MKPDRMCSRPTPTAAAAVIYVQPDIVFLMVPVYHVLAFQQP